MRDKEQTLASTTNATKVQQKKKKKNQDQNTSKVTYSTMIKKATMLVLVPNLQKTSIGLCSFRVSD